MPKDDDDTTASDKQNEQNIEIWKVKKLIKSLQVARGCAGHAWARARALPLPTHLLGGRPPAVTDTATLELGVGAAAPLGSQLLASVGPVALAQPPTGRAPACRIATQHAAAKPAASCSHANRRHSRQVLTPPRPRRAQQRHEHDLAHPAAQGPDLARGEDAVGRVRHRLEHQVARQPPLRPLRHHLHTAAPQALQQGARPPAAAAPPVEQPTAPRSRRLPAGPQPCRPCTIC